MDEGDYLGALVAFEEAIAHDPRQPEAWMDHGMCLMAAGARGLAVVEMMLLVGLPW